jgi:thioredoxin 1
MSENSTAVIDITEENFHEEVIQSQTPTIVDFWAPWCGVCRTVRPQIDAFAEREKENVKVVAVNAQDHPDLANQYGVMALPTFLSFINGQVVGQHVGPLSERQLSELVEQNS